MKVVICSVNSKYIHASPAPWNLLAGIKKFCKEKHSVSICEATINEDLQNVVRRLLCEKPDVLGLCCYIWNINFILNIVNEIKNQISVKIVLGGPEVSYNSAAILKSNINVDYIVCGEGEIPFALLCDAISVNDDASGISGISYRKHGKITIGKPFISNFKEPVFCIDEYINAVENRIAYIETNRGCPFSCAFCLSGNCGGLNNFNLEECLEQIIKLANGKPKIIKFVDRTFNADKIRSKKILRFIVENYGISIPLGTNFHFEIAGDILDDETIEILNTAPKGIFFLEIGMQSFNEKTLLSVNRKTNTKQLIENIISLTKTGNSHIHIDLIAGLPFEDLTSFANSFNIAFSLNADVLQLGFLKLLYGAKMRENNYEYPCSFSNKPPYEVISTKWLNRGELSVIKSCEVALERLYNSNRFKLTCNYLFNKLKLDPFLTLTAFGIYLGPKSLPLYKLADCIYSYFSNLCDNVKLRDMLLCDLFLSANMEKVPTLLRVEDKRLNRFKHYIEECPEYKIEKGIKRRVFLLYSEKCGAYIDYLEKTENKIIKIPFSEF